MNVIRLLVIVFSSIPLLAQAQEVSTAVCLRIQGRVIDYATHQPIATARLLAQTANGWVAVGISGDSGKFSGILPCGMTALLVKRSDYRTQTIPVQLSKNIDIKSTVVLIPLIPVDKQNVDTPYLQTEQTAYVQSDSSANGQAISDNNHIQHNTFIVTDAIREKSLPATLCFFFTKSGAKECLTTNSEGWLRVDFKQKDIVALEVNASGYQPYAGNMLIEQLDGRSLTHKIRLQPELTLLTVDAPEAMQCELHSKNQTIMLSPLLGYKNQYVAYDLAPESLELFVRYRTQKIQRTIQLHTGLNFITVAQPSTSSSDESSSIQATSPKPVSAEIIAKSILLLPDSIPMIYFEQGSYQLRTDSQAVLKQVAGYLKDHPAYVLKITGHTDNVGNPQINQTLSMYRARATAAFLASQHIKENRLIKEGVGSDQPIVPNTTEGNRILNRRVSLKLITAQ